MEERDVLQRERERLAALVADVQARLDKLTTQIAAEGQSVPGSQGQNVLNPLLRAETQTRTELRRLSSDLSVCETKLALLPPEPRDRTTDWRLMRHSDWTAMPKPERLALWRKIPARDRTAASEQVPGAILWDEFIGQPRKT